VNVLFHAQLKRRPGGKPDAGLEIFHLEPVFNVDGYEKIGFKGHKARRLGSLTARRLGSLTARRLGSLTARRLGSLTARRLGSEAARQQKEVYKNQRTKKQRP